MMSLTFKHKIVLSMFVAALATGCANQPAPPVAIKDPPSPEKERQWYEELDVAGDAPRMAGTTVRNTGGVVVHIAPITGQLPPQPAVALPTQQDETRRLAGTADKNTGGMVVHVDPDTGQILPQSPVALPGQQGQTHWFQSAAAPAAQPQEVFSPTPGGGVMVNLNRQFHQPLIATIDETGKVHLKHGSANRSGTETK
ncbi:MAG: hypothetical protein OEN50_07980 [Deltaproteobacteria bacterium]|nr:hypothetical protein [Deltaproteobacteria bacterium]